MPIYADRRDAGRKLAAALSAYRDRDPVILALPRGGVPVGAEIARELNGELDLVLVRKIGLPFEPELAMGAIVDGDRPIVVRNEAVIRGAGVSEAAFLREAAIQRAEIDRRRRCYLGDRARSRIAGRIVIVVDDGIATGATMKAALKAVRSHAPSKLVLAVPVAPAETIEDLRGAVDEIVCLSMPHPFGAIGYFYADFAQVSDPEVIRILAGFPPR